MIEQQPQLLYGCYNLIPWNYSSNFKLSVGIKWISGWSISSHVNSIIETFPLQVFCSSTSSEQLTFSGGIEGQHIHACRIDDNYNQASVSYWNTCLWINIGSVKCTANWGLWFLMEGSCVNYRVRSCNIWLIKVWSSASKRL